MLPSRSESTDGQNQKNFGENKRFRPSASQRTASRYQLQRATKSLLFKDVGNHFPWGTSPTPWRTLLL
jgi:hypothetical protein